MRGSDERTGALFSYVDLEARVRADHPLRVIRAVANEALAAMGGEFAALYSGVGRPSIAPEKLLRAMLLQAFYGIRSERQLMERLDYDLLFRWFVGLGVDDPAFDHRASDREVVARQQPLHPRPVHDGGQELGRDLARQEPVAVLGETAR